MPDKNDNSGPLFHDIMKGGRLSGAGSGIIENGLLDPSYIKFVTLNEIQNTKKDMHLLFVVTEDFQTIIADERLTEQLIFKEQSERYFLEDDSKYRLRRHLQQIYPDRNLEIIDFASHADLARGKPVRTAGALSIAAGGKLIDAFIGSDNYLPTESTRDVMKNALRDFGLKEIDHIKIDHITFNDDDPIITYGNTKTPSVSKSINPDQITREVDALFSNNNINHRRSVMPANEKPGLKELIARFEEQGGTLSTKELRRDFLSYEKIRSWTTGSDPKLVNVDKGIYKIGPGLEKFYKIQTPYGEWRRDLQQFFPKTYAPPEVWQADLKERLFQKARTSALLMEPHFRADNTYHLEFLPVRYMPITEGKVEYHQLVFDHLRNLSPNKLALSARVAEGQGKWELGHYYRTFSAPTESHESLLTKVVDSAKRQSSQLDSDWRVFALSETQGTLTKPQLPNEFFKDKKSQEAPFDPLKETYFHPKTRTLFFGSEYMDKSISQSSYRDMLVNALKSSGKTLSSVTAITFKRILPAVAIGVSLHDVAKADDKIDKTHEEVTKHTGSFAGAAIGAVQGMILGPAGALAGGLLGGFAGWEGSEWLYKKNKEFWGGDKKKAIESNTKTSTASNEKQSYVNDNVLFSELGRLMPDQKRSDQAELYPEFAKRLGLDNNANKQAPKKQTEPEIDAENLSPKAKKVFSAKSDKEFKKAYEDFNRMDEEDLSESDQVVLSYLKDHFVYNYGKSFNLDAKKAANLEKIYLIDNAGRAGIELGKIAYAFKNKELGTFLTLSGTLAQGMSSAMLFMETAGSVAMGHFAGVVGALSSVISLFTQDEDNSMQMIFEAFKAVFEQLQALRKELHALTDYVVQFRKDLFEFLNAYLGALMSRLYYHEEIVRNGFSHMRYEFLVSRDLSEEILKQLDDKIIYKARDFFQKVRNISALSHTEVEDMLTDLYLLLDKSSAHYKSGVTVCQAQDKHGSMAALDDIRAMIELPEKRGQLAGYLACYYQLQNMTTYLNMTTYPTHMINHQAWGELVELYLDIRRAPNAQAYDKDLIRLSKVNQQGLDYIDFIYAQRKNLLSILTPIFQKIHTLINATIEGFEYSENAKLFLRQDHAIPENVQAVLNKFPRHATLKEHEVTNEFLALEKIGLGKFVVRNEGCPMGQHIDENLYAETTNSFHGIPMSSRLGGYILDIKTGKDSSHFHFFNSVLFSHYDGNISRLAITSLGSNNWVINKCHIAGSYQKNCVEEGKQLFLQQRRNFTDTKVALLEKTLPDNREQLVRLMLQVQAIFKSVGLYQQVAQAFPVLNFPAEITPWINFYRADTHHSELYRPWPRPVEVIDTFKNFSLAINEFSDYLIGFMANYTENTVFSDSDMYLVLQELININQFQIDVLLTNQTTSVDSAQENKVQKEKLSQLALIDHALERVDATINVLSNLEVTFSQELVSWHESSEALLNERNALFSDNPLTIAKTEACVDDSQPKVQILNKIQALEIITVLQELCADASVQYSLVEKELEKLVKESDASLQNNLNFNSNTWQRPLHLAILARRADIVELLLSYDAKVESEDIAAMSKDACDEVSQHIAALLNFHQHLQLFGLNEELKPGRTLSLIKNGMDKLKLYMNDPKPAVFLFGKSRRGKSTIGNIHWCKVEYEDTEDGLKLKQGYEECAITSDGVSSETMHPQVFKNLDYSGVDMPGFCDSRGVAYETAAGITVQMLNNIFKYIKLMVLVMAPHDIFSDGGKDLIDVLNSYGAIIGKSMDRMSNVLLLINRRNYEPNWSAVKVITRLQKIADSQELTEEAKFLLRNIKEKNIFVTNPADASFNKNFSEIIAQTESKSIADFNLQSFNRHAEGFKKLMQHIMQYHQDCIQNKNSIAANLAIQQLKLLEKVYATLKEKEFSPELDQQLEAQIRWKNQLSEKIIVPMIDWINRTYLHLLGADTGTLQTFQKLHFRQKIVNAFLDQANKLNLIMTENEEMKTNVDGSTSSSNSWPFPGAEAINIDMSNWLYIDGYWEFYRAIDAGFSHISTSAEVRQFAGKPQVSCVYQWPYGLRQILPRTTHVTNGNNHGLLPLPFCSAEQNKIELGFWKDGFVRLSRTDITIDIGRTLKQTLDHSKLSFGFGMADSFCNEIVKQFSITHQHAQLIQAWIHVGLLLQFYGRFSVGLHLIGQVLKNPVLGIPEQLANNIVTLCIIAFNLLQVETFNSNSWLYFIAPILISYVANALGQKIGRESAKTMVRAYNGTKMFFTTANQTVNAESRNLIMNRNPSGKIS